MEGVLEAHNALVDSIKESRRAYKHKRIILHDINHSNKKIRVLVSKIEYQISRMAKHPNMSDSKRSKKETKIYDYKKKIKKLKKQLKRLNEELRTASQNYTDAGNAMHSKN